MCLQSIDASRSLLILTTTPDAIWRSGQVSARDSGYEIHIEIEYPIDNLEFNLLGFVFRDIRSLAKRKHCKKARGEIKRRAFEETVPIRVTSATTEIIGETPAKSSEGANNAAACCRQ